MPFKGIALGWRKLPREKWISAATYAGAAKLLKISFVRYTFFGGVATLVDWAMFALGLYILGMHYQLAVVLAFFSGASFKFFFNKRFTFASTYRKVHLQYPVYIAVTLAGLAVNVLLMWLFVDLAGLHEFGSRVATTILVLFLNFSLDKCLTFNKKIFRDNA